jgi:Protein of unknown function (DUF3237)
MSIELVHLCDAHFTLREPITLPDTPLGTRMIFEVERAVLEGERLKASLKERAASADWFTIDPRSVGTLDVRLTLETHDGAIVFSSYRGRCNVATGGVVYAAPLYDTGDERYLWLNSIQAIAKGNLDGSVLSYEIHEAR